MIYNGHSGWIGIDWFLDAQNFNACMKVCEVKKVNQQQCPCDKLFKGEK
jgi:hypothetical protein